MKSISIHGVDEEIEKKLDERAKSKGKSVNRVVKELLAEALGLGGKLPDKRADFADLCGIWTKEEAEEFSKSVADLEAADPGDWK